jgi:hypothetical protein
MLYFGDPFGTGNFLLAVAACTMLTQPAYAGISSVAPDKYTSTGNSSKIQHDMLQSTAPLNSKTKGNNKIDYTNICIFCHLPNMANYPNGAPQLNNTIMISPSIIKKTNSEFSR